MASPETTLMTEDHPFQLPFPPIVEAIVDIDCELPPAVKLSDLESVAHATLGDRYPRLEKRMLQQFQIRKLGEEPPEHSIKEGLDAFLLRSEDGKQLTQFRRLGYSFNRLAPYEGMDSYLPEIKRTWENYCGIAKPLLIRKIGLRTINRIRLPLNPTGDLDLGKYLNTSPQIPKVDGRNFTFTGFLNQHQIADPETGQQANIVLATKEAQDGKLTIILDIDAFDPRPRESLEWAEIGTVLGLLRSLKNDLFRNIVKKPCLKLFSNPQF